MKTNQAKSVTLIFSALMLSTNSLATTLETDASTSLDHWYLGSKWEHTNSCASTNSSASSCKITKIVDDGDGYYTVFETFSQSAVEATSLKTGTEITRYKFDYSQTLEYITDNFAPKTDAERSEMMSTYPDYFQNAEFVASEYLNHNLSGTPTTLASSLAYASWTDNWLITGGEIGTEGSMIISYSLDGTVYNDYNSRVQNEDEDGIYYSLHASSDVNFQLDNNTDGYSDFKNVRAVDYNDLLVSLTVDFTFGEEFEVQLTLSSESYFTDVEELDDVLYLHTKSDFFNTAVFDDIEIRDSDGNSLANYRLESLSGTSEFESVFQNDGGNGGGDNSVEIPEPPLVALFALSAIFTLRRRNTHKHL